MKQEEKQDIVSAEEQRQKKQHVSQKQCRGQYSEKKKNLSKRKVALPHTQPGAVSEDLVGPQHQGGAPPHTWGQQRPSGELGLTRNQEAPSPPPPAASPGTEEA